MKNLFLSLVVSAIATVSMAQELRQGSILVRNYPQGESGDVKSVYLIEDIETKEVYLSEPSTFELVVGQHVDFILEVVNGNAIEASSNGLGSINGQADGAFGRGTDSRTFGDGHEVNQNFGQTLTQESVTTTRGAKHDAMMATIQNTR